MSGALPYDTSDGPAYASPECASGGAGVRAAYHVEADGSQGRVPKAVHAFSCAAPPLGLLHTHQGRSYARVGTVAEPKDNALIGTGGWRLRYLSGVVADA